MADTSFCVLMKLHPDGQLIRVPLHMMDEYMRDFPHAKLADDASSAEVQVRVTWECWKVERSQYHFREPGIVELGEID